MTGIIAKESGGNRQPVPVGNHIGRCYSLLEIGTVKTTWEGKDRMVYRVRIGFEFPGLTNDEGQTLFIEIPRTLSLNKNSRLRGELESWRGRPFTADELKGFDLQNILGAPCMINIVHTDDGYERVHAITPLPAGIEAPAGVRPNQVLMYSAWNQGLYDSLPDWLKEEIAGTPEFQKLMPQQHVAPQPAPQPQNVADQVANIKSQPPIQPAEVAGQPETEEPPF